MTRFDKAAFVEELDQMTRQAIDANAGLSTGGAGFASLGVLIARALTTQQAQIDELSRQLAVQKSAKELAWD